MQCEREAKNWTLTRLTPFETGEKFDLDTISLEKITSLYVLAFHPVLHIIDLKESDNLQLFVSLTVYKCDLA